MMIIMLLIFNSHANNIARLPWQPGDICLNVFRNLIGYTFRAM